MVTQGGGRYGTAHTGLGEWYVQRLSAVLIALLLPLLYGLLLLVYNGSLTQVQLLDLVDGRMGRMLHTLFLVAVLTHAYLGVKSIVEDYVHGAALRIPLMGAALTGFGGIGFWWLSVIWAWGG